MIITFKIIGMIGYTLLSILVIILSQKSLKFILSLLIKDFNYI